MCTFAGFGHSINFGAEMIARELILEGLVPLKMNDTGTAALMLMDEYKVSHLPVVDQMDYLGLVSETVLLNLPDPDQPLQLLSSTFQRVYVYENDHFFEVVSVFGSSKMSIIPVLNHADAYRGAITMTQLVDGFTRILAVDFPGSVIILELNVNDYLLSEIAQIVESNDAKIVSLYLIPHKESTKLDVTIRINQSDIRSVLQTFNRYNYIVKATFSQHNSNDDLRDRYDSLMRYLNI
jgi:CBS domain-containing protein